jgi:hypothetical protein
VAPFEAQTQRHEASTNMERRPSDTTAFAGGAGAFPVTPASPARSTGNRRRAVAVLGAVAAFFGLFGWMKYHGEHHLQVADVPVRELAGLIGPRLNPEEEFPERFTMQAAVLFTATNDSLLPVVHALREMGIPFFVTRDLQHALRHRLVILYPQVVAGTFSAAEIAQIHGHVDAGGSIFAQEAGAGALEPILGFREVAPSKRRHVVRFQPGADPLLRYLDRPEELEIRLGSDRYPEIFWTQGYAPAPGAEVLARFEDGSAALLRKRTGRGAAYLSGVNLQDGILRNQTNRHYEAFRHYVNAFEPGADVWMLILRAWYEAFEPGAVRLATVPDGARSVVLFSHDVDWEDSFGPMLLFAAMEARHGVKSLFFIQTKYVSDANSVAFFSGNNVEILRGLHAQGFPLGTHSVIHSRAFNHFALGTGAETYVSYRPRGTGANTAEGATVFGEVRVSRELLDGNVPGQNTVFFRAGHLRVPKSLPEALVRCGYEFDSSFTAPDVLTNFPYALPLGLEFEQDSGLYEFPVTIEDEEAPPLRQRVDSALDVISANAANGAVSVVLIHTNEAENKLEAEKAMLERLPLGVRAMDPVEFARFWRARDRLQWSILPGAKPREVVLAVFSREPVRGLTFEFSREIAGVSRDARLLEDRHRVVLEALEAGKDVRVTVQLR